MTELIPKSIFVSALVLGAVGLAYLAYSQPQYFTSQSFLGGLLLLEFLAAAVWMYRRVFFPLVIIAFLLAGVDLPVGAFWTQARWVFLSVGALAGTVLMLKERSHNFGLFHILAMFAVLTALVSATVSQFPSVALLKALSLVLLFLYAGTGARLAVTGRENRFFTGLLTGCELFVGAVAVFYALGIQAMGNPNSLGAVMGMAAPILLWGTFLDEAPLVHRRRLVLYGICMYLVFYSHSRASLAAALVSSAVLCFTLRNYRMVLTSGSIILIILVAAGVILQPEALSNAVSSMTSSVVYKGGRDTTFLASRQSPWQAAIDSINAHLWFGTGLGTAEKLTGPKGPLGTFSSSSEVETERGSSYLSIIAGVGIVGALPFLFLVFLLLNKIFRTIAWLLKTGDACHPAVPLAMVMIAGLIHAGFEDWLFAPGYYVCVFFWSLAFIFVDVAPSAVPRVAEARSFRTTPQGSGEVAPCRATAAKI